MKIFVCSLTIFLVLCVFVSLNAIIIRAHTSELIAAIENLPKDPDRDLSGDIIDLWFKYEDSFNLTVNHTVTDQIEMAIYNLHNARDQYAFTAARDALLIMLKDMKISSSLAFNRII